MSDPKACPSVASRADFNGELQCSHGHALIHKIYYDEAMIKIATLEGIIAQKDVILGAKLVEATNLITSETDHLGVEQAADMIVLSMKGKAQAFSPKAILDLIKILKRVYNAANNYTRPTKIHSKEGIES